MEGRKLVIGGLVRLVIAATLVLMPVAVMIVLTIGLMVAAFKMAVATLP